MVMVCSKVRHLSGIMMQGATASNSRSNGEQMMNKMKTHTHVGGGASVRVIAM